MKKYLIEIKSNCGGLCFTSINGDTPSKPFSIANNLWLYETPWAAAHRLELLAKALEKHGRIVTRVYGTILDMPTKGDKHNASATIHDYK